MGALTKKSEVLKIKIKFKLIFRTTNWDVSQMITEISQPKFTSTIKPFQGQ